MILNLCKKNLVENPSLQEKTLPPLSNFTNSRTLLSLLPNPNRPQQDVDLQKWWWLLAQMASTTSPLLGFQSTAPRLVLLHRSCSLSSLWQFQFYVSSWWVDGGVSGLPVFCGRHSVWVFLCRLQFLICDGGLCSQLASTVLEGLCFSFTIAFVSLPTVALYFHFSFRDWSGVGS